jgi:hypothetical protein
MAKRPRLSFLPVRCHHKLRRDSCFHKVNGYLWLNRHHRKVVWKSLARFDRSIELLHVRVALLRWQCHQLS